MNSIRPEYASIAITFVNKISPLLASIREIFPYYTRHDAHHGFRVLLRMQEILNENCFTPDSSLCFSSDEILLLICAAYGHDLGMTIFPGEENQLLSDLGLEPDNGINDNAILQNYLRSKHSERGGHYISRHSAELTIPQNLIYLLHKLMEAHNLSINELDSQLGQRFAAGSEEVDLKQLACILCIADSIEFSETRVVDGVIDALKVKLDQQADTELLLSLRHNMQSFCIGDGVAIGPDGKIIFTGTFIDPPTLSLAHNTIDLIENWMRS